MICWTAAPLPLPFSPLGLFPEFVHWWTYLSLCEGPLPSPLLAFSLCVGSPPPPLPRLTRSAPTGGVLSYLWESASEPFGGKRNGQIG
jgi:hypothetical protein